MNAANLQYMPQTWLSDNTDAVDRLHLQFGASLIWPSSSLSGHVATVPNHQNGRVSSLAFRTHVAQMCGSFGFELDPATLTAEEGIELRELLRASSILKPIVHFGRCFRLAWPHESNWPAMLFVSSDQSQAALFAFRLQNRLAERPPALKLPGLAKDGSYVLSHTREVYAALTLRDHGLALHFGKGDHKSQLILLSRQ